jgi:hypothetical protein
MLGLEIIMQKLGNMTDNIEHLRSYYNLGGYKAIDFIEQLNMSFNEGNVFKYLYRCNTLNPKGSIKEDLEKALYYSKRALYHKGMFEMYRKPNYKLYYVDNLNKSAFNENIYFGLISLIEAICEPNFYEDSITSVIQFITAELNEIN